MRIHGATKLLALILSLRFVARTQTSLNSCDRSQRQNSVAATMISTCHTRRFVAATCRGDVSQRFVRVSRPLPNRETVRPGFVFSCYRLITNRKSKTSGRKLVKIGRVDYSGKLPISCSRASRHDMSNLNNCFNDVILKFYE